MNRAIRWFRNLLGLNRPDPMEEFWTCDICRRRVTSIVDKADGTKRCRLCDPDATIPPWYGMA